MNSKNVGFLSQLVSALDDMCPKLETAYNNKEYEKLKELKEEILKINKKISEKTKW